MAAFAVGLSHDPARAIAFGIGSHQFDFGGFVSTGNAVRLADADPVYIGFNTYERSTLVAQVNKVRLSLLGSHPQDVSSLVTVDLLYTSDPRRPFEDRAEVLLDEAYLDFRARNIDFRVGLQKVIWGKADLISPFDILTARDFMDPFIYPTLEDRIAQAGVRLNYTFGEYTLEGVLFPVWIPSRVPQAETDKNGDSRVDEWFPPMAIYPAVGEYTNDPNLAWIIFLPTYNPMEEPKKNPSTATFGLKLNTLKGDYDIDFYLLTAMDPTPTATVKTVFATGTIDGLDGTGLLITIDGNMEFKRVTTLGAAVARTLGPVSLRSELAFVAGRQYFRLFDPAAAEEALNELAYYGIGEVRGAPEGHSEVTWIAGADYEVPGIFLMTSTQLAITSRFSHEDYYTQGAQDIDMSFLLQRGFREDHITASFAGLAGFKSKALWLSPALSFTPASFEDLQLGARFNFFAGEEFSKIGMYGDESSFIFTLRWLF
jgi:hypothetical protein